MLQTPELKGLLEIGAIITILKPDFMKYCNENINIFLSQFLSTGAIVFSDTQSYSGEELSESIMNLTVFVKSHYPDFDIMELPIYTENWDQFIREDFEILSQVGRTYYDHRTIYENHINAVDTTFFLAKFNQYSDIEDMIQLFLTMKEMEVIRIKGNVMLRDKTVYAINCTHNCIAIKPCKNKHAIITVIGSNLNHSLINDIAADYSSS